jgi:SH3-like domain-containing protein
VQAEHLLKLGGEEFRKENYGGVLYLTSQAKTLIKGGQARTTGTQTQPPVEGEVPFSVPVPLRATGKGNVREGPGMNFRVAFVVEDGTPLTGQSYKGTWVRVRSDDGRWGWISHSLIGER